MSAGRTTGSAAWTARALLLAVTAAAGAAPAAGSDGVAAGAPAGVTVEAADRALTARLHVAPAHPAPGEAVELRLTADVADGADVRLDWPDVRAQVTAALGEHVVEVESVRLVPGGRALDARLRLYDEGEHALPPFTVTARRGDQVLGAVTLDGVPLAVAVDVPPDAAPAAARDALPLDVPPAPPPWPALAACGAVLAALVAAYVLWRRRTRVVPPPSPPAPAHERALAALRALAARALPARGEVEPYFVELSEILRTYLEERFGLRAPEQTTEEFLATVSHTDTGRRAIESAHRELLRDFLTRADLVKFARARPDAGECGAAGESAERFVRETSPAAAPAEAVA